MDPFTAGLKYILRSANDKLLSHRTQKPKILRTKKQEKICAKPTEKVII